MVEYNCNATVATGTTSYSDGLSIGTREIISKIDPLFWLKATIELKACRGEVANLIESVDPSKYYGNCFVPVRKSINDLLQEALDACEMKRQSKVVVAPTADTNNLFVKSRLPENKIEAIVNKAIDEYRKILMYSKKTGFTINSIEFERMKRNKEVSRVGISEVKVSTFSFINQSHDPILFVTIMIDRLVNGTYTSKKMYCRVEKRVNFDGNTYVNLVPISSIEYNRPDLLKIASGGGL